MPVRGSGTAVFFPSGGAFATECGRRTLKHPWFQLWVLLLSITSAGTVGKRTRVRGEGRQMCCRVPLPPSLPPAPPPSLPSLAHPPQTLPVWSICLCLVSGGSAISSHIAQMVSMHASVNSSGFFFSFFFCNCQFPYQSVCISMVERGRKT